MGYQRWTSFMVIAILVSVWRSGYIAGKSVRSGSFTSQITAACPLNQTEFSEASQRMNCTGNTRYLCAPNANLSALVEFCSVAKRLPFGPDNCVTLQSNGYLNHVSCKSTFEDGCPNTFYFDDEIFKFPKCLLINVVQRCFLAEQQCKYVQSTTSFELQNTTRDDSNRTSSPRDQDQGGSSELLRLVGLPAVIPVIVLVPIIIWCCFNRGIKRYSFSEEHGHLIPRKTDEKGEEKLKFRKEKKSDKILRRTPYRKKLDEMQLDHLTVLYSLLFLRNNEIELKSEKYWLSVLNEVRSLFGLNGVTAEIGRQNIEKAFRICLTSIHPVDTDGTCILDIPDDLLCEIFWNFFRQTKFESGRLDYFLDEAQIETIATFCRTHNYQMIPTERCLRLPPEYTEKFVRRLGHRILSHSTIEDQSIHEMLSKKFDIPMEVLSWGKDGIQRFIAYLNCGKEPVYHSRGMIVGCAGAGKTTLVKRLQDCSSAEIFNFEPTKGIEVHPAIFKVEDKQLQVNKEKSVEYFNIPQDNILGVNLPIEKERVHFESISHEDNLPIVKERVHSHENELESNAQVTAANTITETEEENFRLDSPISQTNIVTERSNTEAQTSTELQSPPNLGKIEHRKSYKKTPSFAAENALKSLLRTLENVAFRGERSVQYLTLMDFAGQSAYYACHQIYFSARALYILVMDMSKDLDADVGKDVSYHSNTVFDSWKYRDFYAFWMKSIHTYSSRNAPVILVATHAENKTPQDIEKFTKEVFDILDYGLLHQHLVNDSIFTLTLPEDRTGQVESIDEIKQCIIDTVEKQPYWGEDLPSSWVVFEKEIRIRKESSKIMKIKDLQILCEGLSDHVFFEPTEMKDALRFFNEIGSILYFDSADLEETVILDVQWFVNSFKNIITHSQDARLTRIETEIWERFCRTGELDDKLLGRIWQESDDFGESFFRHKNELLSYMQHLGLLARGSKETNNVHLIPCMTKRSILDDTCIVEKYAKECVFSYKFDFFPFFIFWRFVVACVCSTGWELLRRDGNNCIFKDSCILRYNGVEVVFKINDDILDAQILGIQTLSLGLKVEILRKIKELLQRLTKTFHRDVTFTTGCRCKPTKIFELGNAKFLSATELRKLRFSGSKQCSVCECENHPVAVEDLSVILEENEESHGYQQIEMTSSARKTLRKNRTESEGPGMEFGVDDVKLLESIQRACSLGNKQKFDHELQKLRNQKEILFAIDLSGCSLLHFACEGGDLAIVQILIDEGFELNPAFNGKTVLHIASQHGHIAVCDYVLSKNPELLKITDHRGGNAAHYAAEGGHTEMLKYLLEKGIDPEQLTKTKRNILHIAASNDQHDLCKHILQTYPKLLNSVDFQGWNALHCAASQGHVEIFDILVESKVDVKTKSTLGDTVLHIACLKSRQEMCKRIMRTWPELIKEKNTLDRTPIFSAAEGGDIAILKLLRDHNADEEAIAADNHTLLHVASEHSHYEICEYLVEKFPGMTNKLTKKGWNALHMLAAGPKKTDEDEIMVFNLLVNHDLDIHQTTKNGSSILKLACKNIKKELCKLMMENHPTLLNIPNVDHLKTAKETNDKDMIELFETYCQQI